MSAATVAVCCPECAGASADNRLPPCDVCLSQGHFLVNRLPDGTAPATWDDGRPVVLWCPPLLPDTPMNPLVLRSQRVGP